MDREEYNSKINELTMEAVKSNLILLDIVTVLESSKMAIQFLMFESARREGSI